MIFVLLACAPAETSAFPQDSVSLGDVLAQEDSWSDTGEVIEPDLNEDDLQQIRLADLNSLRSALMAFRLDRSEYPSGVRVIPDGYVFMIVRSGKMVGCNDLSLLCATPVTNPIACAPLFELNPEYLPTLPVSPSMTTEWDLGEDNKSNGTGYTVSREGTQIVLRACEHDGDLGELSTMLPYE